MSALRDFAEWFKVRRTKIRAWYDDDVGRFAFKVKVDGTPLICVARRSSTASGTTSIMKKVVGRAHYQDALIVVRMRDDVMVFDPVTIFEHGECGDPKDTARRKRGEEWVYFPVELGCRFEEWFDGHAAPVTFGDAIVDY